MGKHGFHEPAGCARTTDPLAILLCAEGEESEADALEAFYESGCYVTRGEAERFGNDMLGASPAECFVAEYDD